jgi:hypothetical protein
MRRAKTHAPDGGRQRAEMFMLDTNAFNQALDSGLEPSLLSSRGALFVTHIQLNELQATKKTDRLSQLLGVFSAVEQETVPTAAAVWNVSEWGGAEWGSADGTYDAMLASLNGRNRSKKKMFKTFSSQLLPLDAAIHW